MITTASRKRIAPVFTTYLPVILVVVIALFPFVWTFITSIKPSNELYTQEVRYWPNKPTLENYSDLFNSTPFSQYFLNSTIVALSTVLLGLVVSLTASYSFSRFTFKGRDAILFGFLVINMFPQIMLLTPLLVIMRAFHLLDTPVSLVLAYSTFTIPFSTWMLTGFFDALPRELEEAAMVDGCTQMGAFRRILLPLAAPGIAATAIYIFINAWNEFIYALTFTASLKSQTVPVGLRTFIGAYQINWGSLTAAGILTSLPIVIAFMFIQKQLIRGLTAGSVKG